MNVAGKRMLVVALVAVVGMAFRVSWNALRDIATAIGADGAAATLYPFVVDGLMALALVAALVLTGDARLFALRVLAGYTIASLALNYVHGLAPALHGGAVGWGRLAANNWANWPLVLLATSLPVGSIYFGSDLVAKVLHHRPPIEPTAQESVQIDVNRSMVEQGEPAIEEATRPPALQPVPVDVLEVVDPIAVRVPVAAAEVPRSRRATGRVPESARSARPVRTAEELLSEARSITEAWPVEDLTGERIRKALRTSPAKARVLRETLKGERAANAAAEAVAG
ncbi:DUF2637 domain-containing protein [Streptomyces katrae]|uniref:DUF2637 domain-containing protein n=1 Tax=Streptomyces katrae TaxID=68223 RepID=UPI0004C06226|nr:DUF2637 domain-containing protein [Streptomyces katrae]